MSRIIWLPSAKRDLRQLRQYIARDSRRNATRFVQKIRDTVNGIRRFPESGSLVPELEVELREIFVGSYRVIYRINEEVVEILNVIHGARLMPDTFGQVEFD